MFLKTNLTLIFLLLATSLTMGQYSKNKDSILTVLRRNKKEDSVKVIDYARAAQLYNQGNPDSAFHYLYAGLKLAKKVNFQRGIALINSKLGTFYLDNGSYKKADSVFRIALDIHQKLKRYEDACNVLQAISAVYTEAGDEVNSLKYILAAKAMAEQRGLVEQLPFCNGMIGIGYQNQGDTLNAIKYLEKGIQLSEGLRQHHQFSSEPQAYYNLTVLSDLCSTIAEIFASQKNYAKAMSYYDKAMKTSKAGGFYDVNVLLFISAADVYRHLGDEKKARTLLDTAMVLAERGDLYREKYKIYAQLGMLDALPERGLAYFKKASILASKQRTDLMEIFEDQAEYAASKGRYKEALYAFKRYEALKDSVSGLEKAKQIANLKAVNQLQETQLKVRSLSKENFNSKINTRIVVVISLLLLALIVAGVLYYKRKRRLHLIAVAQKNDLAVLNEMKDKIFYIIGHDLRGPLSNVQSITELMAMEFEGQEAVMEYVDLLKSRQKHALEILDKLLTWGKLEFQKADTGRKFQVLQALQISLQGIISGAELKEIVFQVDVPETLEIQTDANHFDFIIRNLLQNALKFTPMGGKIRLSYQRDEQLASHVFSIRDSGVGMSEAQLDKVLSSGLKTTPGTSNEKGTGIGLLLVKKIADQNNHRLRVESREGGGTTFYYQIPF